MSIRRVETAIAGIRRDVDPAMAALEDQGPRYESLRDYSDAATHGRFDWHTHNEVLADKLEAVVNGTIDRLLVFMPPRHGKTLQVSQLLTGFYLHRHPDRFVGLVSYGATLAHSFNRRARDFYRNAGLPVSEGASAAGEWETGQGGGSWAAGVGGPLTGRGFHLGILDDPVKSDQEADSDLLRIRAVEWYQSTFYTRAEPGAAIVVVMTRWHEEDLAGWLLEREPEALEGWHIVNLPAVREPDPDPEDAESMRGRIVWPESCRVEPDWREVGEALCPQRYPLTRLQQIERTVGPRAWSALYQQRPSPREGSLLKPEWFKLVESSPVEADRVRYWDVAGTDGRGDFTAGVLMSKTDDGRVYIEDVVRGQWSPGTRDGHIALTAHRDREFHGRVTIWLESEAGIAGSDRTQETIRRLSGFTVRSERPTGSKEHRAEPLAAQAEGGNVYVVKGAWNTAFFDEIAAFPHGRNDDMVDAASGAFSKTASYARPESVKFLW